MSTIWLEDREGKKITILTKTIASIDGTEEDTVKTSKGKREYHTETSFAEIQRRISEAQGANS